MSFFIGVLLRVMCIRPVIEYACQHYHDAQLQHLSDELRKNLLCIGFPNLLYGDALETLNLMTLSNQQASLTANICLKTLLLLNNLCILFQNPASLNMLSTNYNFDHKEKKLTHTSVKSGPRAG